MSLLALTMSYQDIVLDELELASIPSSLLSEAVPCLLRAPDVKEALVLSTCNRTEIYAWVNDPVAATSQVRLFLEDLKDLPIGWTEARAHVLIGDDVIRHVFQVTAGLDSMVLGESEIQGQVRKAYKEAAAMGAVGPHLHGLFRWALEAGKRVRHATGLARATDSFPKAAHRALDVMLKGIATKEVLVVGNGRMAIASLRQLAHERVRVGVVARRLEAAEGLAAEFGAFALPIHALQDAMIAADAVVFATSAREPLVDAGVLERVLTARQGRPFVVVDLGLPRNVAPEVAALDGGKDGFYLYDLAGLDAAGFTVPGGRDAQLQAAADIIATESERCVSWFRSKPADAVVSAIQAQAKRVAEVEGALAAKKISGLDERQRAAVERAIEQTVRKIVHIPTVRAKEACARGDENLLQAARWLFGLEEIEAEMAASNGSAKGGGA
ncbi:MAG: glutamyl-tRNA reductase [Actinomycetota bacterium]